METYPSENEIKRRNQSQSKNFNENDGNHKCENLPEDIGDFCSRWKCCRFENLPAWLQDNDSIHRGYRPPLPSFTACFKSIFRIHTETGNIWTHLLGCLAFIGLTIYYVTRPSFEIQFTQKLVFAVFFACSIACLGFSFIFHTLVCHSESVGKLFSKLDYLGIALQTMGSFFPWLYYAFYCEKSLQLTYMSVTFLLGITSIIVSLYDKFGTTRFRHVRAGVFCGFGLSGIIPTIHYILKNGLIHAITSSFLGHLLLMACLYLLGAWFYVSRFPERWYPGKYDIWFHSHQLFHVLVIAAAVVCFQGMSEVARQSMIARSC